MILPVILFSLIVWTLVGFFWYLITVFFHSTSNSLSPSCITAASSRRAHIPYFWYSFFKTHYNGEKVVHYWEKTTIWEPGQQFTPEARGESLWAFLIGGPLIWIFVPAQIWVVKLGKEIYTITVAVKGVVRDYYRIKFDARHIKNRNHPINKFLKEHDD